MRELAGLFKVDEIGMRRLGYVGNSIETMAGFKLVVCLADKEEQAVEEKQHNEEKLDVDLFHWFVAEDQWQKEAIDHYEEERVSS